MDWWNISVFGLIPVLTVFFLFCIKPKQLCFAPLMSTALAVIISLIAMPAILDGGEAANIFFKLVVPVHFLITLILAVIAYGVLFIFKKKHKS